MLVVQCLLWVVRCVLRVVCSCVSVFVVVRCGSFAGLSFVVCRCCLLVVYCLLFMVRCLLLLYVVVR